MSPRVVATTCLTIDHALFARRKFDYCIVDEGPKISLPTCLGPLRFAGRFVLCGDHFRFCPSFAILQQKKAGPGGQYRMDEDIMQLSNKLNAFASAGPSRSGTTSSKRASLSIPSILRLSPPLHSAAQLRRLPSGGWGKLHVK